MTDKIMKVAKKMNMDKGMAENQIMDMMKKMSNIMMDKSMMMEMSM